jgi:dTDP-4-dehydrorhamnose reductase
MKVLVFGATGMLGNAIVRRFSEHTRFEVFGTVRGSQVPSYFSQEAATRVVTGVDVENHDSLVSAFLKVKPALVINCVGLVKQLSDGNDPLVAVPMNTLLPHKLARLSELVNARLIQVSTDCVFSGKQGAYVESDTPDASDVYGRSKLMGEVDYPHCVTLRTSIIGHELSGNRSLVGWFLSQKGAVKGFPNAIFSGFPTVELADIIIDQVVPRAELRGLYHVAANPISKFDLLTLVAQVYRHEIEIRRDDSVRIDRSLNADRFNSLTGYRAPEWRSLVQRMEVFR